MTYAATAGLAPRAAVVRRRGRRRRRGSCGSAASPSAGGTRTREGTLVGADHLAFYTAGPPDPRRPARRHVRLRGSLDRATSRRLIGWDWDGFEAYRNPPFYALLYLPTAGLSYYASFLIWTAIGLRRCSRSRSALLKPAAAAARVPAGRSRSTRCSRRQLRAEHALSLAVFAGVYRLLANDRPFAAGLVAGLLWFKPQLLLGLFVWWAFYPRRYFRCWLGVGVTGLVLAAVSWLAVPEASRAFVETLRTNVGVRRRADVEQAHPAGVLRRCSCRAPPDGRLLAVLARRRARWPGSRSRGGSRGGPARRLQ